MCHKESAPHNSFTLCFPYSHEELRCARYISWSQSSKNFNKEGKDTVKGMLCWSKIWTPPIGSCPLRVLIPMGVPQWGSQEPSRHIAKKLSYQKCFLSKSVCDSYANSRAVTSVQGKWWNYSHITGKDAPNPKQKDQRRILTGNLLVSHWHMVVKFHGNSKIEKNLKQCPDFTFLQILELPRKPFF